VAVAEGERAVALNPNDALGYQVLTEALSVSGRPADAVRAAEKAARLDSSGQDFYAYFIGHNYVLMGRYQEAIPLLKRSIATYPNIPWPHSALIVAYTEQGRGQDASAEVAKFMRISPGFVFGDVNKDAAVDRRWESDLRKAGLK
jgi:adenylate cyclase